MLQFLRKHFKNIFHSSTRHNSSGIFFPFDVEIGHGIKRMSCGTKDMQQTAGLNVSFVKLNDPPRATSLFQAVVRPFSFHFFATDNK